MLLDFKTYKSAIRQCDIGGRIDTKVSGTEQEIQEKPIKVKSY